MANKFTEPLLSWYQVHARSLPWRDHPDPYRVWVSEIMLQQTRVATVLPYFQRWLEQFPDIHSLAQASQQEVLSAWEGLGYYSRARNLHQAARIVVADFDGQLPQDINQLMQLPGIGRYTAGAIASIAFGNDAAVLDGNIRRLLSRVFDVRHPARSAASEKLLWKLVEEHLPQGSAAEYNQALMELGSLVCTPRQPRCGECPLSKSCLANALGIQEERPLKVPRPPLPHHVVTSAVIQEDRKFLIARRPPGGLLGGMWEFPGGKLLPGEDLRQGLEREICEELGIEIRIGSSLGIYQHAYTHFRVTLHAFLCQLNGDQPRRLYHDQLTWCSAAALQEYPMGKIDRQISNRLQTFPGDG